MAALSPPLACTHHAVTHTHLDMQHAFVKKQKESAEMDVHRLEETLEMKTQENKELMKMCEELMEMNQAT